MQIEIKDKGTYKTRKFLKLWLLFLFFIVPFASFADAPVIKNTVEYKPGCGHLRGFIYKYDVKSPLWGAQVVLQQVETRQVFRSNVTDSTGDYELLDIPTGNYVVLILTRNKIYNIKQVDFLIKIIAGKTSTISFSLKNFLSVLMLFLKKPCCEAAVFSGTALAIALVKKFTELKKEPEQSPTQR
jgi:hypothetical protein